MQFSQSLCPRPRVIWRKSADSQHKFDPFDSHRPIVQKMKDDSLFNTTGFLNRGPFRAKDPERERERVITSASHTYLQRPEPLAAEQRYPSQVETTKET